MNAGMDVDMGEIIVELEPIAIEMRAMIQKYQGQFDPESMSIHYLCTRTLDLIERLQWQAEDMEILGEHVPWVIATFRDPDEEEDEDGAQDSADRSEPVEGGDA